MNAAIQPSDDNTPRSKPWLRQPNETPQAYQAYEVYRDTKAGERSQEIVADKLSKSRQLMARWSRNHAWISRCIAYDNYLTEIQSNSLASQIDYSTQAVARRHLATLDKALAVSDRGLQALLDKGQEVRPRDLVALAELAVTKQRLILGESTSRSESVVQAMSDDVLMARAREIVDVDPDDDIYDAEFDVEDTL